jgi:3',5'-cyclic AMP phosphodiesterase CpdA
MTRLARIALGALATAGALLLGQDVVFVQMTDPQFGMETANRDFAYETARLERAAAEANRLKPRFVIVTGDLVNAPGDGAQIAEYQRILKKLDAGIRVYSVAGNHDVGNVPTAESLAAYRKKFGADWYGFREGPLYGIVLNSVLYHSPQWAPEEARKQREWLTAELKKARASGAAHVMVFLHHPLFIENGEEPDEYFNIPMARRIPLMNELGSAGVRWVFSGHYHRNAEGRYGQTMYVTTGPVGKPLGGAKSGFRVVWLRGAAVTHEYVELKREERGDDGEQTRVREGRCLDGGVVGAGLGRQ